MNSLPFVKTSCTVTRGSRELANNAASHNYSTHEVLRGSDSPWSVQIQRKSLSEDAFSFKHLPHPSTLRNKGPKAKSGSGISKRKHKKKSFDIYQHIAQLKRKQNTFDRKILEWDSELSAPLSQTQQEKSLDWNADSSKPLEWNTDSSALMHGTEPLEWNADSSSMGFPSVHGTETQAQEVPSSPILRRLLLQCKPSPSPGPSSSSSSLQHDLFDLSSYSSSPTTATERSSSVLPLPFSTYTKDTSLTQAVASGLTHSTASTAASGSTYGTASTAASGLTHSTASTAASGLTYSTASAVASGLTYGSGSSGTAGSTTDHKGSLTCFHGAPPHHTSGILSHSRSSNTDDDVGQWSCFSGLLSGPPPPPQPTLVLSSDTAPDTTENPWPEVSSEVDYSNSYAEVPNTSSSSSAVFGEVLTRSPIIEPCYPIEIDYLREE